jgi:hypothetical protein
VVVGRIKTKTNNKKELERCRKWKAIFGRITGADVSMSWIFSIIVKRMEKGRWRENGRLLPMPGSTNLYAGKKTG